MAQEFSGAASRDETAEGDLPVVAFDFDGTLTVKDSFTAFLRWRAGAARYALGVARLAPAAIAYLFHRDRGRMKAQAVKEFLHGVPHDVLEADARRFAESHAGKLLRPDALETWRRWRGERVKLVIVTASPDIIVGPFGRALGADAVLGTQLSYDPQNRVLGAFSGPNCRGAEKVVRLKEVFGPHLHLKAAYGDTSGDTEMLAMAEIRGFRVFKAKPG